MHNFEKLIVKILNYVNMIIKNKDDKFNFFKEFSKKISNLNIILEIYNENPIKAVQNLISSYNKYGKYLLVKKKNIYYDLNKKYIKKITETRLKSEVFAEIPKHLICQEVCDTAFQTSVLSITGIPDEFVTEEMLLVLADKAPGQLSYHFPKRFKTEEFVQRLVAINPLVRKYIVSAQQTEER